VLLFINMKWTDFKKPILGLAPMADMTDSPFCATLRSIGGVDVVFREMVSSEAIVRRNEKTLRMSEFYKSERPIVQQIFGADPKTMARAASMVLEHSVPDGIDINMGCPVYKITSNFNGAALMKEPKLAGQIVSAIKEEIGEVPLSVKIRLGWDNPDDFKQIIPILENAGVDLISIHGRTKTQGYGGKSDWKRIREAKKMAKVPILANGDIYEPKLVDEALKITGADGVMIGRGALGNPWFFYQYKHPDLKISLKEKKRVVLEHAKRHLDFYGQKGIVTFRKHLSWYFKTNKLGVEIQGIKEFRSRLVRVDSLEELEDLMNKIKI
jgi:tRNA-dihydrouridine synthase B